MWLHCDKICVCGRVVYCASLENCEDIGLGGSNPSIRAYVHVAESGLLHRLAKPANMVCSAGSNPAMHVSRYLIWILKHWQLF